MDALSPSTRNIAHRGARAFAPENTLEAFAKAGDFGCDMIELDVHLAKDGEIVVHHDEDLRRCTDVERKFPGRSRYLISDFDYLELSRLDAGSWFVAQFEKTSGDRQWFLQSMTREEQERYISANDLDHYGSGSVKVPTLAEVLALAANRGLVVNIELKLLPRMYPGLTDAVLTLVESIGASDRVLLSSFDHEQLWHAHRLAPNIATAVLSSERLAAPWEYLKRIGASAFHPSADSLGLQSQQHQLDTATISALRAHKFDVNVWTCNQIDAIRKFAKAGVSGLISDYPNRVRQVLDEA